MAKIKEAVRKLLSARVVFRVGAFVNWAVAAPGIIAPKWSAAFIGIGGWDTDVFSDPFLLRVWTGMAVIFGIMFWEISRDPEARCNLIKYAWMEKILVAISVAIAYWGVEPPEVAPRFVALIAFTDGFFGLLFLCHGIVLRGGMSASYARLAAQGLREALKVPEHAESTGA